MTERKRAKSDSLHESRLRPHARGLNWRTAYQSPAALAAIYLLLVPGFAVIYSFMWTDLLQSTASSDVATEALQDALRNQIVPDLSHALHVMPEVGASGAVAIATVSEDDIVEVHWVGFPMSDGVIPKYTFRIVVRQDERTATGPRSFPCELLIEPVEKAQMYESAIANKNARPFRLEYRDDEKLQGWLDLPAATSVALRRYSAALGGRPAPVPGGFGRYLYFSIVTITTLGYGDIVPLTDRARLAVGAEALCGVVLAGLFINAVATRSART